MEPTAMKAMIVSMLAWIGTHTNDPMPADTPMIAMVPHGYLESIACKGPCDVIGIYADSGVVYLDDGLALESNVCARSVLVHELVHFFQDIHGRFLNMPPVMRWKLRENEAHEVQKAYLSEHGRTVDFGAAFRLGAFTAESCGYPRYAGG